MEEYVSIHKIVSLIKQYQQLNQPHFFDIQFNHKVRKN